MDFNKIDSAIDLLKQVAASTTEEGIPLLRQLADIESSMSLAEKCHNATMHSKWRQPHKV